MEFERYEDGVPSWVDLGSPDLAKSREFYGALFGWNCPEGPPEAGGLFGLRPGREDGGGPRSADESRHAAGLDDLRQRGQRRRHGGQGRRQRRHGLRPADGRHGRRAAWRSSPTPSAPSSASGSPDQHTGAQVANEPGTYCWSELITTDLDASKAFYGAVFGWGAEDQGPPGGPPAYTEWKLGGRSIGGMMLKSARHAGGDAAVLGRLLRGGRHRRHRGEGAGARRQPCSWGRPTSSPDGSPSSPTTSAPSSTSCSSRDSGATMERRRLGRTGHESSVAVLGGAACWAASRRGGGGVAPAGPRPRGEPPRHRAAVRGGRVGGGSAPGGTPGRALHRRQDAAGQP